MWRIPVRTRTTFPCSHIASNGALTEVFPRTSVAPLGSLPQLLAHGPRRRFPVRGECRIEQHFGFLDRFQTGALTPVANSPFSIGLSPLNMRLTPSGKFLYVTAASEPLGLIAGFSVNSGSVQLVSLTPTPMALIPLGWPLIRPASYLYAANTSSNSISIFTIGSSGALNRGFRLSAQPYNDPVALLLDPKGQYLYVADQAANNVAVYSITSGTGLPVGLTTSTTSVRLRNRDQS